MKPLSLAFGIVCVSIPLLADVAHEPALGLIISPGDSSLIPARSQTPLTTRPGDILFAGDSIRTGKQPVTYLYCPGKASQILAPSSEALFGAGQVTVKTGKLAGQSPVASCLLPTVAHLTSASEQHYGTNIVRGLDAVQAAPVPDDKLDAATKSEIGPFTAALRQNPSDVGSLVQRAAAFEKRGLLVNALADYRRASAALPDAVWLKGKLFELDESIANAAAAAASTPAPAGQTFAVLIGISNYQKLPNDLWLHFADADAKSFDAFLASPRGGSVPRQNVALLTNEQATTAAIRNAFASLIKGKAGKNDTVIITIAAHGIVETPGNRNAYIVTYDTDPQDLATTAFGMAELQDLITSELTKIGRVILYADVCRSGTIGAIKTNSVNASVAQLGQVDAGDIFEFMASEAKEQSREGLEYGGGHGVFSYYVLKSFGREADQDNDGKVTVDETVDYVRGSVEQATQRKQHPYHTGTLAGDSVLADLSKGPGPVTRLRKLLDSSGAVALLASASPAPPLPDTNAALTGKFQRAIGERRLLPGTPGSAFDLLPDLKAQTAPEIYQEQVNALRVALENAGQQVVLRYLQGDQVPQLQTDFISGSQYFNAAQQLTPGSLYLDSRTSFCQGRALLFDKRFADAARLLERAVRIDPQAAYAYNALGIAYLERADFTRAVPAFRDAIQRAPQWTYPYHNLALASIEDGDFDGAIRAYQQAIKLAPSMSYLHYNLGLLYERLNRRRDAQQELQRVLVLDPGLADTYNALGALYAGEGKTKLAETNYKQALSQNPALLAARQNLAVLYATRLKSINDASALWRENIRRDPDYLPSRISLAEQLAATGDKSGATEQFQAIIRLQPGYAAAHVALGKLLLDSSPKLASAEFERAADLDQGNPSVLELLGDAKLASGDPQAAALAYRNALIAQPASSDARRLRDKLARLASKAAL